MPPILTVAMATYDDFDGVYFSLQAIRLYHPEILDDVEFLVLDNHPAGPQAEALRELGSWIGHYSYWPYDRSQGTAVRDLLFRRGSSEFVLVMDSHVLFAPGALARLIGYLREHRTSSDLLQGPLLADDGASLSSHLEPVWSAGLFGTWALDNRALDPEAEPFEIPAQGLGVFVCRRAAWPGLNPRFAGFGGEEGYLHEKVRRAGGRTLCLPFLRWMHRFGRPAGPPYPNRWSDRLRNYRIAVRELGLDPEPLNTHFRELLGADFEPTAAAIARELEGPYDRFDAIYAVAPEEAEWKQMLDRFEQLGCARRVRRALSRPEIADEARWQGLEQVLVCDHGTFFALEMESPSPPQLFEPADPGGSHCAGGIS